MSAKRSRQERQGNSSRLKIVFPICCGMDVHRDFIVACIASTDEQGVTTYEKRRFSTFTGELRACRDWLIANDCYDVCMESTGKYWFPVHNVLEQAGKFKIVVTHPKYVKAIKGKKTDKRDAQWISDVFKFDMVRGSFIPPETIRQLRDLCRFYVKLTSFNTSEKNRAQNCLTWGNYKLDSVFSNVFGKSASAIVDYMLAHPGEKFDVAPLVDRRCKTPIPQIQEAVDGELHPMQAEKLKIIKEHMSDLSDLRNKLQTLIFKLAEPYEHQIQLLQTAPGLSDRFTAIRVIAEIGVDMTVFDSAKHLVSWAGLCPQNAESAGKKRTTRIGKAGVYIKPLLVELALTVGASKKKHPEMVAKFQQIKKRRGYNKAHVAIARKLLVAIYSMLAKDEPYNPELYRKTEQSPKERTFTPEQAIAFLRNRGYTIIDEPSTAEPTPAA